MLPVCCNCECEMNPSKNGRVVEYFANRFRSDRLVAGDEYECPGCEARIVTGFGKPFKEHGERDYAGEALTHPDRVQCFQRPRS